MGPAPAPRADDPPPAVIGGLSEPWRTGPWIRVLPPGRGGRVMAEPMVYPTIRMPRKEWEATLRADPCAYCERRAQTVDHIVATSVGGTNGMGNLTGACRLCNGAKGELPLLMWMLVRTEAIDEVEVRREARRRARQERRARAKADAYARREREAARMMGA
jgi:hypothetical protein